MGWNKFLDLSASTQQISIAVRHMLRFSDATPLPGGDMLAQRVSLRPRVQQCFRVLSKSPENAWISTIKQKNIG